MVLALENKDGKKILDISEIQKLFKFANSRKKGAYIAMLLGVVTAPILIGFLFIISGLAHLKPSSQDCVLFDIKSIEPFLKKEGFQTI